MTTARPPLLIWGAAGHALVVADIVRLRDEDDGAPAGREFAGTRVLGGRERLSQLRAQGVGHLIFGIGDGATRLALAELARRAGFAFATAVHPRATVAGDVRVGEGTVVAAAAVINPAVRIGAHVIVNTAASIDHECVIEGRRLRVSRRAPGRARLRGTRRVGGDRRGRGRRGDIPDGMVAYDVPARVVRRAEAVAPPAAARG